jgi:hypothetical protein
MTFTPQMGAGIPLPAHPGVLSVPLSNSASEINIPVYVPWRNCQLSYAYAVVTTVVDTAGAMNIDLELNAAGGTAMMNISATGATIGTIHEATVTSRSACRHLDSQDSARDAVMSKSMDQPLAQAR